MKNILLGIALAWCCFPAETFGQAHIRGRITDGVEGLPFANVMLLKSDSSPVQTITTDEKGKFVVEKVASGHYLIATSTVGFTPFISLHFHLTGNVTLPDIMLKATSQGLDEAAVKTQKPGFEQQSGGLVMHLKNSIPSSGNTVLEILQQSLGVVVDRQSGRISMNGKAGTQFVINGKLMQISIDAVIQMVTGMNASDVEKVEFIQTPPSKYDAEGNAGIILITTKQNADLGTIKF